MTDAPAIEVLSLAKIFVTGNFPRRRRVKAVDDVSFVAKRGQVFGLLGPNGAGKSTAIKVLLGLISPTRGTARLFGLDPSRADARREVGFLPENPLPYEYLTAREFVELAARLGRLDSARVAERVSGVIERVGLTSAQHLQIRRFSKGMVQRVSLAQALVTEPRLLVLDEPTSGLDVLGRRLVRDIILEERAKGTTVLFSSHIIPDVEALCDEVALIVSGRLVKSGKVRDLVSKEQTQVEIVLDGLSRDGVQSLGVAAAGAQWTDDRVVLRTSPEQVSTCVQAALRQSARLVSVNPVKYSLEELFIDEIRLRRGGDAVGGVIT
jgi:ABC-2 type transport system ATP-binding protein